ncbi:MAG: hypothetical protein A2527_02120 [Candidatus Lambdaproteobacteria bacterium RIFOXYD2_FULL_50_16]|uniref:Flippase-like domain-containing protein n=1 Tax=Candidatus Lambdaproteobacteria bacterium RIFOXYD2_FULL_50_16 TaxID=1817772 RepID=A0A1F6GE55_9PROT|nr:MAG: hypothetical protein A2527_02120 [Candidatus Lambdaproteobacteria bacterium RIFOXYD2_FULL_50_16]
MKKSSYQKTALLLLLKSSVVGLILYFLWNSGKLDLASTAMVYQQPLIFWASVFLVVVLCNGLMALRWQILLRAHGISFGIVRLYAIQWIGFFFSTLLPGTVSGEGVKAYYLIKETGGQVSRVDCITVVMFDKLTALIAIVLVSLVAIGLHWPLIWSNPALSVVGGFVVILFSGALAIALFWTLPNTHLKGWLICRVYELPYSQWLLKFSNGLAPFKKHPFRVALALVLSVSTQLIFVLIIWLVARQLCDPQADWVHILFAAPLGELSTIIPLAPGGIGVGHAAYDYLFLQGGLKGGADVFTVFTIIRLGTGVLGGLPYLFYKKQRHLNPRETE